MIKKHRLALWGIIALAVALVAGVGSFAVARSGNSSTATSEQSSGGKDFVSRHVDYDVTLNVTGDLSKVDPKLQGVLPLNLNAKGGADIKPGGNGPEAQGNLQLTGVDSIIKQLAGNAAAGGSGGNAALAGPMSGIISGALSNLDFTVVDHQVYLKLGGVWYSALGDKPNGDPAAGGRKHGDQEGQGDAAKACVEGAIPGGPASLINKQTVGQEDVDGTATTHFSATVDVNKALADAVTAASSCGKPEVATRLQTAQTQIAGAIKELKADWWQDGQGNVVQIKAAVSLEPSALGPVVSQMAGAKAAKAADVLSGINAVSLNATLKFSRFGEDFQISKPDGDIQQLPFKGMLGHGRGPKGDANGSSTTGNQSSKRGVRAPGASTL